MTDRRQQALQRLYKYVRVIALVGVLAYLVQQILSGRASVSAPEFTWRPWSLAAALAAAMLAYQLLPLAWIMLLKRSGLYEDKHLASYVRIWWISYIYRYLPGKVLLLIERARLGARVAIPYMAGAALPIVETLLAVLAGCVVSLLALSFYGSVTRPAIAAILLLSFTAIVLMPAGYYWLVRLPWVQEKYPALQSTRLRSQDILAVIVFYVAHYLLLGLSLFLIARCFFAFEWSSLPGLCGIYALSHVASLLIVLAPGGLGVREGALAFQLQTMVPASIASSIAIGARIWFTGVELLCLGATLMVCPRLPPLAAAETEDQSPSSAGSI